MEIRLLKKGYKNNEQLYKDFLDDKIVDNEEYFSDEVVTIDEAPSFPIYMGSGSKEVREELFLKQLILYQNIILIQIETFIFQKFSGTLCSVYIRESS